jgi:hypothetical protein
LQQGDLGASATVEAMVMRRCYSCAATLPESAFAPDPSKGSGVKSICRRCDREKARRYYAANRERKLAKANARNVRIRLDRHRSEA